MVLEGAAKRAYQREYMRQRRSAQAAGPVQWTPPRGAYSHRKADDLALQIVALINTNPWWTTEERLMACLMVIGDVLTSIPCAECRSLKAKAMRKMLPRFIAHALAQPIPDQPHTH